MAKIPILVGLGGVNAAGRTSGDHGYRRTVIDALDDRGAWVEDGRLRYHGEDDDTRRVISSQSFVDNLKTLARFIAASSEG